MEAFFSETVSTGGGDAIGFGMMVAADGTVDFDLFNHNDVLDNNVFFYDVLNYYVLNYYVLNVLFLTIVFIFLTMFG